VNSRNPEEYRGTGGEMMALGNYEDSNRVDLANELHHATYT
jgi:hypothetical protein